MPKTEPKGIPADLKHLRQKDFKIPAKGPFRSHRPSDLPSHVPKDSVAAKEAERIIIDGEGQVVATVALQRSWRINRDLLIKAVNGILNVGKKLHQDPLMIAKLLEDGEVISGALTTSFDGMQAIVTYMGELREYFPGLSLDQVPKDEMQAAIDEIRKKRQNPSEQ